VLAAAFGARGVGDLRMRDLCYILGIVVFFLLMHIYVEWCKRLGKGGTGEEDRQ
jgi:hypothetical protein